MTESKLYWRQSSEPELCFCDGYFALDITAN